jgi:hypothetical protein
MTSVAILARKVDFHWNWCPSCGMSTSIFPGVYARNVGLRR